MIMIFWVNDMQNTMYSVQRKQNELNILSFVVHIHHFSIVLSNLIG